MNIENLDNILLSNNVVESFHEHYDNNKVFQTFINKILPEIEDCKNQVQNNPWHKYNVLDHILHSVEEMNKQTTNLPENDRRLLAYTMLLHDIGKPACHIQRMKDGKMIDSFFNHNLESERVANRVYSALGFSEEDGKILAKLVRDHDIFMNIKLFNPKNPYWKQLTPELVQSHIDDLSAVGDGGKLMRYLVKVGRADNLAQNEKMTKESLDMLQVLDKILDDKELQKQ